MFLTSVKPCVSFTHVPDKISSHLIQRACEESQVSPAGNKRDYDALEI